MASPLSSLRSTTIFKTCHMLYAINWCGKFFSPSRTIYESIWQEWQPIQQLQ
jgi:hypothetical protein